MSNCDDKITLKIDAFREYEKAVIGSARARHTYFKRLKTVSQLSGGFSGKRILDVGCGYGFRTLGILGEGARRMTGVDLDRDRIFAAKNYALERGGDRASFLVTDSENMGFKDHSFDLVVADEMIHHVKNLTEAFSEMYRVIRPGGVIVVSDHNRLSLPSEMVRSFCFGKNKEKVFSAIQIRGFLKEAGFREISYRHIIFTLPFARLPQRLVRMNAIMESFIEGTPLLRRQCGVYVIRGFK